MSQTAQMQTNNFLQLIREEIDSGRLRKKLDSLNEIEQTKLIRDKLNEYQKCKSNTDTKNKSDILSEQLDLAKYFKHFCFPSLNCYIHYNNYFMSQKIGDYLGGIPVLPSALNSLVSLFDKDRDLFKTIILMAIDLKHCN